MSEGVQVALLWALNSFYVVPCQYVRCSLSVGARRI